MKRILIYLILAWAPIVANATNWVRDTEPGILEVHYTRTQVTDTTRRNTDYYNEETMLRIGKGKSMYCSVPRFNRDSLMYNNPDLYWQMERIRIESAKDPVERDMQMLSQSGRYVSFIYKNYPEGKVTETEYFDIQAWHYDEDWEKPEWEVTEETKEILGYQCFKAVTDYRGRRWTAWFAPEIPVQDGPWKLCGLPGLILEASDNHNEYHFLANGLKQNGVAVVGFLCYREKRGVRKVSRDKFFNSWWKYTNSNFGAKFTFTQYEVAKNAARNTTDYRTFKQGVDNFYNSTSQRVLASFSYRNTRKGVLANAMVMQSWSHKLRSTRLI